MQWRMVMAAWMFLAVTAVWGDMVSKMMEPSALKNAVQPLDGYDFKKGGYTLIGIDRDDPDLCFYLDDAQTLETLKTQWSVRQPLPGTKRIYSYTLILLKEGEVVEWFPVDLKTGMEDAIRVSGQLFAFDRSVLQGHRPLLRRSGTYDTPEAGRAAVRTVVRDDRFVYGPRPEWFYFDGYLEFEHPVPCTDDRIQDIDSGGIDARLSRRYGSDSYRLQWLQRTLGRKDSKMAACWDLDRYRLACNAQLAQEFEGDTVTKPWRMFDALTWEYWVKAAP